MTYEFAAEAALLTDKCREIFGDESRWITANGYPNGLALAIIDSIFSTGSHYQSVINVVNAYRAYRSEQGADADYDGTFELLATFTDLGGSGGWADMVNNQKPAHTKANALLKAEVIKRAAVTLESEAVGITTRDELHAMYADDGLSALKSAWLDLPSQRSGVTYNYLLILAGFQSVKPDRMVIRFISEHAGLEAKQLSSTQAADLITAVAELYPTQPRRLDHVIWRHVSGREVFRADELN
ncbi:hypothetical protein NG702_11350 [Pseudarthrobacter sp. MDT3-28]|uniref:hypothetical protein n=1 Tax=Pseudarthrobacter raffinosi TaxID=2953651 RepID=UPI00208F5A7B|nr:hypothetical protein [Pseudarthrobacter sp. MDT3-28]MCO4237999.1 hypothetical protein [Pseudarthrobacter sp. MDT3-28]